MSTENSTELIQKVFVILDENERMLLRAPLFIDDGQEYSDIKKSLTDWFSRYTDFDRVIAREVAYFSFFDTSQNLVSAEVSYPFLNLEPYDIIIECDPSIRENEKQIIRDKMKYENYRNNAVEIYEKYLKRKEIKKKWQKKK